MSDWYREKPDGTVERTNDFLEGARAFEEADRTVAKTTVGAHYVSTVFLGLDHSFGRGLPLLYETMVFPVSEHREITLDEEYCERYTTRAQAKAGHDAVVAKLERGESLNEDEEDNG